MWGRLLAAAGIAAAFFFPSTPVASASAESFCAEMGGQWDGQYCHSSVLSERNATRDIKMAMPADLVTNPTTGPVIREYLRNLFENWKAKGADMVQDSWGEENFQRHVNASRSRALR